MLSHIGRRGLGLYSQHGTMPLLAGSCCPALNLSRGLQGGANPHEPEVDLLAKNLWVNTLTLTKSFEKAGISRSEAEALAEHLAKLIVITKNKLEDSFVKHQHLEKIILEQEAKIVGFKTELQKSQDIQQTTVAKDLDRQQSFLDKMRTEVKHEIDKLTASQRLDLNLEKGRMRDDLQMMRDKATELEIKVDRDINELRSAVEKAKNDTIKSVITILGTFSAIAFTISRFVQMSNGG